MKGIKSQTLVREILDKPNPRQINTRNDKLRTNIRRMTNLRHNKCQLCLIFFHVVDNYQLNKEDVLSQTLDRQTLITTNPRQTYIQTCQTLDMIDIRHNKPKTQQTIACFTVCIFIRKDSLIITILFCFFQKSCQCQHL